MINNKGEEVICTYDFCECEKCDRNCMIKFVNSFVVDVKRVPELEKRLEEREISLKQ